MHGEPVYGKIIHENGQIYTGPIKNRKPNGNGAVTLVNGNSFKANFNNAQIDSSGVLEIPSEGI